MIENAKPEPRTVEDISRELDKANAEFERVRSAKAALEIEYHNATENKYPKFF